MQQKQGDDYQAVLPAPWVNSEYIEYLFLTVGIDKVVSRSQLFRIDEEEIKEAARW